MRFVDLLIGASSGLSFALFGHLLWAWIDTRRRRRRMAHRLDALSPERTKPGSHSPTPSLTATAAAGDNRLRCIPRYLLGIDGIGYAGQRFTNPQRASIAGLAALAALAGTLQLFGFDWFVGVVAGIVVWLVSFRKLVSIERRRSERSLIASFPDAVDMVVRMVRAGMAVSSAIRAASRDLPPPLGPLFTTISEEYAIGVPLDQVITTMATRVRLAEFRFFAVAISLQHATGGGLTDTLETLAEMMRRRRAIQLKAKALVAEVRTTALVLSTLPVAIVLVLLIVNPEYIRALFVDQRGNLMLFAAALCVVSGAGSMHWIMRRNLRA
ncbi:MAG: type II secretion system F family protein [Alphaproteobacteria bacterium]|nr:type II secretion system F family protein [Alphaproteobacteria bacterium]